MQPDLWSLYALMLGSRLFEEAVARLWYDGKISGEMHMGMGEEAIVAGVVAQLVEGDAMALDHRGTPPMLMRGVEAESLLLEFLGDPDGLCRGMGGHMHLFSPQHLAASSGIVGASGPAAAGFALAAQQLRPGSLAVAFFGEGATNQGMLLESMNLAVVWKLPVLFVCKDDNWAILTDTDTVFGSDLVNRAGGFGMPAVWVDGSDVEAVYQAAGDGIQRARAGDGPSFLHASCVHLEGHFLGDPYLRFKRQPLTQARTFTGPLAKAIFAREGLPRNERLAGLKAMFSLILNSNRGRAAKIGDPLKVTRRKLKSDYYRLRELEENIKGVTQEVVDNVMAAA